MDDRSSTLPGRGAVYASHLRSSAVVAVQFLAIAAALWVLAWVVGETWVILLPVALALIVCTVLWPPVRLSLIHISEPTRRLRGSRMPSSA